MPTRHEAYLRHAHCYVVLAEEANAHLTTSEQATWLQELDSDYESFLAVLRWLKTQKDGALGSRLALALCQFWDIRGHWAEARQWLESMAAEAAEEQPPDDVLLARVLNEAGIFCRMQSDLESASAFFRRALAIHQKRNDLKGQGTALNGLGAISLMRGEQAAAREFLEAALAVHREREDPTNIAQGMNNLALVYFKDGDYASAEKLQKENLTFTRKIGYPREIADVLTNLGNIYFRLGNYGDAKQCHLESLELKKGLNYQPGLSDSYLNLAALAAKIGEYSESYEHLRNALQLYKKMGDIEGFACVFEETANLAVHQERTASAAFWYAAAAALRRKHHVPLSSDDAKDINTGIAQVRLALGEPAFQAAWKQGRMISQQRAIARILTDTQ